MTLRVLDGDRAATARRALFALRGLRRVHPVGPRGFRLHFCVPLRIAAFGDPTGKISLRPMLRAIVERYDNHAASRQYPDAQNCGSSASSAQKQASLGRSRGIDSCNSTPEQPQIVTASGSSGGCSRGQFSPRPTRPELRPPAGA
jgi:hypothetical protein